MLFSQTALHWAAKSGKSEVIKLVANKPGVHVDQRSVSHPYNSFMFSFFLQKSSLDKEVNALHNVFKQLVKYPSQTVV